MDCPICFNPVGFVKGKICTAPVGVPLARRDVNKAAAWAASQAVSAGGTLKGYTSISGAGVQYANYWTSHEVLQADVNTHGKQGGP